MSYEAVDVSQTDSRYPFDPRANAFELAKIEKLKRKQNPLKLITIVPSTGPHYFFGPSKCYSMEYPLQLDSLIPQEEYETFILEINEVILKYWPCFFTFVLAFTFSIITCFMSLYLPRVCLDDVQRFLGYVLGRWNETWEEKGILPIGVLQNMNQSSSSNIKLYLDCSEDSQIDHFDTLVNYILQNPKLSQDIVIELKESMQLVDLKKKIRILQLMDEVLSCNDLQFKQAVQTEFLDLLYQYYEHQSKTVQSDYLSQEDEIEVIELYIYVNKVIGYFTLDNKQIISVKDVRESIRPTFGFTSRPSIVLDDVQHQDFNDLEDKQTQTEFDAEIEKWKSKWELQVKYNQRLQKINQSLRNEVIQQQQKLILMAEEDQIIIDDEELITPQSILKKNDEKQIKSKKVQFDRNKELIKFSKEQIDLNLKGLDPHNLQLFKKCCLLNQCILFDDKIIQILLQKTLNQQLTLTFLNKSTQDISKFNIKYQNAQQNSEILCVNLRPKQFEKQIISSNFNTQIIYGNLSYTFNNEQINKSFYIPNFIHSYIKEQQILSQQFKEYWNQLEINKEYIMLYSTTLTKMDLFKIFPNSIHDQIHKYKSLLELDQVPILLKINYQQKTIKIIVQESKKAPAIILMQQLLYLQQI